MHFAKAGPSEFLVTSRNGVHTNHGTSGTAFVWPGMSWVLIPGSKQEASFEMTQETKDGIPLRFKGIIIYHVEDPVLVASVFDFSSGGGLGQIQTLLSHVSLGELRSVVANLTMDQCITQRRTTLSDCISKALHQAVHGSGMEGSGHHQSWGIELDVVQVAQVYIVDVELRKQLEAKVRSELRAASELAELAGAEKTVVAKIESERRTQQAELETERQRVTIKKEEALLTQQLEEQEIAASVPVQIMRLSKKREVMAEELELKRLEGQLKKLELEIDMARRRGEQDLRKEMLPLEQAPEIARALAGVLQGTNLTLVGGDPSSLLGVIAPLVEYVSRALASSRGVAKPASQSGDEDD